MSKENTNTDRIQSLIEDYKKHITKKRLDDEVYKWELVEEYNGRPNLDVESFKEDIKSINYDNLVYNMAKPVLNRLVNEKTEETRLLFEQLFDESKDLTERVKLFNKETLRIYKEIDGEHGHHQDERTISAYLTYRYPKKYTFYKYAYYKNYCDLLNIKTAKKNERYTHYLSLIDNLIENYIKPDSELIEQVKGYIPKYYKGGNHKILAQDILYQMQQKTLVEKYWVFQANPSYFDFESAMKDNAITSWTVTAHREDIKEGDKVIVWLTGEEAGCYALAEVKSDVYERTSEQDDKYWLKENMNKEGEVVDIEITHNLVENPLLKDDIEGEEELDNLKVGHQGTNFTATEKEYNTILKIIEQTNSFEEVREKFNLIHGASLFKNFMENLRKIVKELKLEPNDKRIVYSVRYNRFNFIIGQRYSFNIHLSHPKGVYGFISNKKLYDNSHHFKGKPEAYYNSIGDFNLSSEEWKTMIDAMNSELNRTSKSSFHKNNNKEFEGLVFENIDTQPNEIAKMTTPTNTILYGPPGTGKTYNTVNKALEIIDSEFLEENVDNREALNKRFRSMRFNPATGEGQIAFITFHQSLSYEDFIEGIKPKKNEGDEEISYEVCDGIFKSIAIKASDKKVVVSFDEIYKEFIGDVMEKESFSLNTPVQKKPFDVRINGSGNCVAIPQTETATQMVVTKKMIADFLVDGTVRDWKPYLSSIAEYIKANYSFKVDEEDNANKPYVIIIDEINRGNISQIFGELITLIEPDKRNGQAEEIEVILPYSKERFSVPSNLHIIGTMNTADRSVEALDTALRRRFSFMEMNPAPWLLDKDAFRCEGIDLNAMLKAINGRIEKLLDRDYCIGHSYFMTIKDKQEPLEELKYIFQNKILPLLQEYFYGNWGKIRLIVGQDFVEGKNNEVRFLDAEGEEDIEEYEEKLIYNFTNHEEWTLDSFKSIYEEK